MIKLLATAAIGLTMMSGAASADVSHCGMNESRMNPTELSAYQECWLDVYKADVNYGKLGSLFWVRANGEYYSTQLNMLRNTQYRDMFLADIEEDIRIEFEETTTEAMQIVESFVIYVEDTTRIAELEAELEKAKADHAKIAMQLAAAIASRNAAYAQLTEYYNNGQADALNTVESIFIANGYTAHIEHGNENTDIQEAIDMVFDAGYKKGDEDLYKWIQSQTGMKPSKLIKAYNDLKNALGSTPSDIEVPEVSTQIHTDPKSVSIGLGATLDDPDSKGSIKIKLKSNDYIHILHGDTRLDQDHDDFLGFTAEMSIFITDAVEETYERGYADGYADGYTEGYAAGYVSGLAN